MHKNYQFHSWLPFQSIKTLIKSLLIYLKVLYLTIIGLQVTNFYAIIAGMDFLHPIEIGIFFYINLNF